ncbi:heavy metal sensor histidine kinase [Roseateles sp. DAIF2]|uniref:heavy metal sensor histidine kinase n=1 Tax=Roseateles sp. DAIF2 TaxID=2714952 RepID=UPI0018A2A706|nr:heavy metal sensor histidine kinase [Roseateles sp. DAIF2]QPF74131.1 heavy metal sensor histidine kinase [Roseateles sp. DAIF2]
MSLARTDGLGVKLSRWLALQTIVGLGAVCTAVYFAMALTLAQRQDDTLAQKQQAIRLLVGEGRPAAQLHEQLRDLLAGHNELSLLLVDTEGQLLFDKRAAPQPERRLKHLSFELARPGQAPVRAQAWLDISADQILLRRVAWTLALAAVAGAAGVSAGGYWLVRRGLAPLRQLTAQTQRLGGHDPERRLDGSGQPTELQPLVAQFNALLDRLAASHRQMEAFNADVAHELNTPLATLISSCELALRRSRDALEMREIMGSNLEELRRMAGIVADMLFLAHADRGSDARRQQLPSLAALAAEVLEFHEAALQEAELSAEVRGDAAAALDGRLLRRALSNLLGNATRYARPGTRVRIDIATAPDGMLELSVANEGPAIAAEHLPRLFDRFYRADPSRAQADRNHGLGLSIVAAIARMHGGSAFAESGAGRTRIGLRLPMTKP